MPSRHIQLSSRQWPSGRLSALSPRGLLPQWCPQAHALPTVREAEGYGCSASYHMFIKYRLEPSAVPGTKGFIKRDEA